MKKAEHHFKQHLSAMLTIMENEPSTRWWTLYEKFFANKHPAPPVGRATFYRLCVSHNFPRFEPELPEEDEVDSRDQRAIAAYKIRVDRHIKRLQALEHGLLTARKKRSKKLPKYLVEYAAYMALYPDSTYEDLEKGLVKLEHEGKKLISYKKETVNGKSVITPIAILPSKAFLKKVAKERDLPLFKKTPHPSMFNKHLTLVRALRFSGSSYKEVADVLIPYFFIPPTYQAVYVWMKKNDL